MIIAQREECLTANEVGLWLGLHVNTVKRIPFEELPYFRIGNRDDRRYFPSTIREYIHKKTRP